MTRITRLKIKHIDSVPDKLEVGVLYVSSRFATAMHLCCCGCGHEVVTLSTPPNGDWSKTVTEFRCIHLSGIGAFRAARTIGSNVDKSAGRVLSMRSKSRPCRHATDATPSPHDRRLSDRGASLPQGSWRSGLL